MTPEYIYLVLAAVITVSAPLWGQFLQLKKNRVETSEKYKNMLDDEIDKNNNLRSRLRAAEDEIHNLKKELRKYKNGNL